MLMMPGRLGFLGNARSADAHDAGPAGAFRQLLGNMRGS